MPKKTLDEGFEIFLSKLKPKDAEMKKAASHRKSVKSCLSNHASCKTIVEKGSFGNGTGIRHYSDIDYFAILPSELSNLKPSTCLLKLKEALQYTFWKTEQISISNPSVRIKFGTYKSEELELTPSITSRLIETSLGKFRAYKIPNSNNEWVFSSPNAHNAYILQHDKRLNGKLKPLIQLVKAWKFYNKVSISSFYLELRVAKYASTKSKIDYPKDLAKIFSELFENSLPSINDPMGISGLVPACKTASMKEKALSKLNMANRRATKALNAQNKNDIDTAFDEWIKLFYCNFPNR